MDLFTFTTEFAYLGPETMLPMTSVVAGAVGVLLMFGRNSLRFLSGMLGFGVLRRKARPVPTRPGSIRGLADARPIAVGVTSGVDAEA